MDVEAVVDSVLSSSSVQDSVMDRIDERTMNQLQKHKLWLRSIPIIYDRMHSFESRWPSLSLQWLPGKNNNSVLASTQADDTPDNDKPELHILQVDGPELGSNEEDSIPDLRTTWTRQLERELNTARYMPQNPNVIAGLSACGNVILLNTSSFEETGRLTELGTEGFSLDWNKLVEGKLLGCSNNGKICMWDINELGTNKVVEVDMNAHGGGTNEVSWMFESTSTFGSVGEDNYVRIWDSRDAVTETLKLQLAKRGTCNCFTFNPHNKNFFATSISQDVQVWDMRNLQKDNPLMDLSHHDNNITHIKWNPQLPTVYLTGGEDGKINLWDMSRQGTSIYFDEYLDGPEELIFMHSGHLLGQLVLDVDWCTHDPWTVVSSDQQNEVQVWKPAATNRPF